MEPWWRRFSGGRSLLLVAALVALAGFLILYAFATSPPGTPKPSATADPEVIVPSENPPAAPGGGL